MPQRRDYLEEQKKQDNKCLAGEFLREFMVPVLTLTWENGENDITRRYDSNTEHFKS